MPRSCEGTKDTLGPKTGQLELSPSAWQTRLGHSAAVLPLALARAWGCPHAALQSNLTARRAQLCNLGTLGSNVPLLSAAAQRLGFGAGVFHPLALHPERHPRDWRVLLQL